MAKKIRNLLSEIDKKFKESEEVSKAQPNLVFVIFKILYHHILIKF